MTRAWIDSIAIVGKTPPPVGGVAIHVKRLLGRMERLEMACLWIDLSNGGFRVLVEAIRGPRFLHLHTSSPYFRLFVAVIGKAVGKKVCITYHGNLGRFGWFANQVDRMSVRVASIPILLNEKSFEVARRLNGKSCLVSAFIRPEAPADDAPLREMLKKFVFRFDYSFATNAYDVSFDRGGSEIYGISELMRVFEELPKIGLVLSDPTGNYKRYLQGKGVNVPANVLVIERRHEFVSVLDQVDGLIRATTTDGDSLSVREGLFLGKVVIASDCVDRPDGVVSYETGNSPKLHAAILSACRRRPELPKTAGDDGADVLIRIYRKLLLDNETDHSGS